MATVLRLVDRPANDVGVGRIVRRECGCGECGVVFEAVVRSGQGRLYAEACPFRAEQVRRRNRASNDRTRARLSASNPRRCKCGCGRVLPPRVWYHPDCKSEAQATRERDGARDRPPAPGQRCRLCEGLTHRRHPEFGCLRCGAAYAPEQIRRAEVAGACPLGLVR